MTRAFMGYAGSKNRTAKKLLPHFPKKFNRYFEPFLGSGAVYFCLAPKTAYLSDSNAIVIDAHKVVRDSPEELATYLKAHFKNCSKDYFYFIRGVESDKKVYAASRLIYLSKASFDTRFRLNKQNKINSGYRGKKYVPRYDYANLEKCARLLKNAVIESKNYQEIRPEKGDFVYLDPPYYRANQEYGAYNFSESDESELKLFCDYLTEKQVFFVQSNAVGSEIYELYKKYRITTINVQSIHANRGELVISNSNFLSF